MIRKILSLAFILAIFSASAFSDDVFEGRLIFFSIRSFWESLPNEPDKFQLKEAHFGEDEFNMFQSAVKNWEEKVGNTYRHHQIPNMLSAVRVHQKEGNRCAAFMSSHCGPGVYVAYVFKKQDGFEKYMSKFEEFLIAELKKVSEFLKYDRRESGSVIRGDSESAPEAEDRLLENLARAYQ